LDQRLLGSPRIHSERTAFVALTVRDHLGRIVMKRGLTVQPGPTELPLRSLPAGVYFATCQVGDKSLKAKLVLY